MRKERNIARSGKGRRMMRRPFSVSKKRPIAAFSSSSALACSFLTASQSCKETLAAQGLSLAPRMPPLAIESRRGLRPPNPRRGFSTPERGRRNLNGKSAALSAQREPCKRAGCKKHARAQEQHRCRGFTGCGRFCAGGGAENCMDGVIALHIAEGVAGHRAYAPSIHKHID